MGLQHVVSASDLPADEVRLRGRRQVAMNDRSWRASCYDVLNEHLAAVRQGPHAHFPTSRQVSVHAAFIYVWHLPSPATLFVASTRMRLDRCWGERKIGTALFARHAPTLRPVTCLHRRRAQPL